METTKLRGLLEELHGELEKAEAVEPETRQLLANVMDDIHGVLGHSAPSNSEPADSAPSNSAPSDSAPSNSEPANSTGEGSIRDRLREEVVKFENSHPHLSFTLERLMKSLSDIGI